MNRVQIVSVLFVTGLMLSGCTSTPQTATPVKAAAIAPVKPVTSPIVPGTDAQRLAEDEKFWRGVEEKKRKSHSAYLNKTKAYTNYIP